MALTNVTYRATGLPGSDNAEQNRLLQLAAKGWIVNAALGGSNATQVSISAFAALVNGQIVAVAASGGTALFATGIGSLATGTTGAFVYTISVGGTLSGAACVGVTAQAIAFPTIPSTQLAIGMSVIACTAATAFNGGTNSLADSSYTVSHYAFTGPAGLAVATENWTNVPG